MDIKTEIDKLLSDYSKDLAKGNIKFGYLSVSGELVKLFEDESKKLINKAKEDLIRELKTDLVGHGLVFTGPQMEIILNLHKPSLKGDTK